MSRRTSILTLLGLAAVGSAVLGTDVASARGFGDVTPFLDCVGTNPATGNPVAFFGYSNTGDSAREVQIGPSNQVVGGPDGLFAGQPTNFNVGTYPRVFSAEYTAAPNALVVWQLNGDLAQANASSPSCQSAVTSPASALQPTSATLNGTLVPGGLDTAYKFEYGTAPGYGSSTPVAGGGNGTVPSLVQADVTGLAPGTVYYFRIVASNATGTTYGAQQTFTTPAASGLPTLTIKKSSLPDAQVNKRYSVTLHVTGGAAPYTWSVVAGSLPDGLSLGATTGKLSGTPTTQGTSNFTVQVTGQGTGTRSFTLTVK